MRSKVDYIMKETSSDDAESHDNRSGSHDKQSGSHDNQPGSHNSQSKSDNNNGGSHFDTEQQGMFTIHHMLMLYY